MIRRRQQSGFTVIECLLALAALTASMVGVAQLATWMAGERGRVDARLEAIDAATNLLEEARSRPWEEVTSTWAAAVKPPAQLSRWPDSQLTVKVEPEPGIIGVKRVSVEIKWTGPAHTTWVPVTLTALFASRTTGGKK